LKQTAANNLLPFAAAKIRHFGKTKTFAEKKSSFRWLRCALYLFRIYPAFVLQHFEDKPFQLPVHAAELVGSPFLHGGVEVFLNSQNEFLLCHFLGKKLVTQQGRATRQ